MPLADLPTRRERSAPFFDDSQPKELAPQLERYFADLQALLNRYSVADENQRKQAAVGYLRVQTEALWKTTEAWADQSKTYAQFKSEVFKFYPGASGDQTYRIWDLEMVIGHFAQANIQSMADLGEYHRRFRLISHYLIGKGRLSTQEQSRAFFRGFQPHLEVRIRQRLQQKFIDHFPDDPYTLADIYEAASFVLIGTPPTVTPPVQGTSPTISTSPIPAPDPNEAKIEALTTAIASLSEAFMCVIQTQQAKLYMPESGAVAPSGASTLTRSVCHFCGGTGHSMQDCEVVTAFTQAGKSKRNHFGSVVLPSGATVHRSIPGAYLADRIDEYHRQNPGQLAAPLRFQAAPAPTASAPSNSENQRSIQYLERQAVQQPTAWPARTYMLRQQPPPSAETITGSTGSKVALQVQQEEASPSASENASTAKADESAEVLQEVEAMMMVGETLEEDIPIAKEARRGAEAVAAEATAAAAHNSTIDAEVVADPYKPYLCKPATSAHPAQPSTVAIAETDRLRAISPIGDGKDKVVVAFEEDTVATILPNTHHFSDKCGPLRRTQERRNNTQEQPSNEDQPASQNECTTGTKSIPHTQQVGIIAAHPFPFPFISAPRQSASALSFLGARAPLSIFTGKEYKPVALKVRSAQAETASPPIPATQSAQRPQSITAAQSVQLLSEITDTKAETFADTSNHIYNQDITSPKRQEDVQVVQLKAFGQEAYGGAASCFEKYHAGSLPKSTADTPTFAMNPG
jgi:hypothetical protein